mmetsp:Transcript_52544/g.113992  ORF Transcript_52544/g.113992 Transcript_52544/m.113992 type:complete len:230 (+) Transcript_52544:308-997(+)
MGVHRGPRGAERATSSKVASVEPGARCSESDPTELPRCQPRSPRPQDRVQVAFLAAWCSSARLLTAFHSPFAVGEPSVPLPWKPQAADSVTIQLQSHVSSPGILVSAAPHSVASHSHPHPPCPCSLQLRTTSEHRHVLGTVQWGVPGVRWLCVRWLGVRWRVCCLCRGCLCRGYGCGTPEVEAAGHELSPPCVTSQSGDKKHHSPPFPFALSAACNGITRRRWRESARN